MIACPNGISEPMGCPCGVGVGNTTIPKQDLPPDYSKYVPIWNSWKFCPHCGKDLK
jgi:hypothetical protein